MVPFMVLVALAAVAVLHAWRLALPPRASITGSVTRWEADRARATRLAARRESGEVAARRSSPGLVDRAAARLADLLTRRGPDLTSMGQDLAVTESTLERYLSRAFGLAALGLVAPVAMASLGAALGLGVPVLYGLTVGVLLAAGSVLLGRKELTEKAAERRAELRRALSIWLDLVVMSMEAGRGHAEALPAAARIGTGWCFEWLQDSIDSARYAGVTPWAALGQLGTRVGVSELVDIEGTLTLAADDGAKIRNSLIARAETMRAKRLADTEAQAEQATDSMKFCLIVLVFTVVAYELYPPLTRLFTG